MGLFFCKYIQLIPCWIGFKVYYLNLVVDYFMQVATSNHKAFIPIHLSHRSRAHSAKIHY
ncbi:hypothetical protein IC575_025435 [Cucumis melo]